jgi:hypothetical protein
LALEVQLEHVAQQVQKVMLELVALKAHVAMMVHLD